MGFGVWGLGFRVWGLGFGVWGLGFRVWGLGFGVWGLGFRVWGLGFGVQGLGCRVGFGLRIWGSGRSQFRGFDLELRIHFFSGGARVQKLGVRWGKYLGLGSDLVSRAKFLEGLGVAHGYIMLQDLVVRVCLYGTYITR